MKTRHDMFPDERRMQIFKEVIDEMHNVYKSKHHDYGPSFEKSFHEYGPLASMIRVDDKINRFKTLITKSEEENLVGEKLIDTLIDAANYLVMFVTEFKLMDEYKNLIEPSNLSEQLANINYQNQTKLGGN